jgi:hypothetical protein
MYIHTDSDKKMGWAEFRAIFSQTHLATLFLWHGLPQKNPVRIVFEALVGCNGCGLLEGLLARNANSMSRGQKFCVACNRICATRQTFCVAQHKQ